MTKKCTFCKFEKPVSEFYPRKDRPGSFIANCKPCTVKNNRRYRDKEYRKKWASEYYQKNKKKIGLRKYGLSPSDYDKKLKQQNDCCAICKNKSSGKRLFVDHNHNSNKVRGLLCLNCNILIGQAKELKQVLINAIEYLSNHEA